jgi:hypothetical protein
VGFADNHAELVKLEKLWELYWVQDKFVVILQS